MPPNARRSPCKRLCHFGGNRGAGRNVSRSSLIVNDLGVIDAYFGEEIQRRLGEWAKDVEELD